MVKVNASAGEADAAARRRAPRQMGLRRVTPLSCVTFRCRACGEFILRRYGWRPSGLREMAREIMEEYEGLCPHCGAELQVPSIPTDLSVNGSE